MIPRWLATFARSVFPPRRSPPRARPTLRLEPLETREVLTTVSVEAPAWWPNAAPPGTTDETRVVSVADAEYGGLLRTVHVRFSTLGYLRLYEELSGLAFAVQYAPPTGYNHPSNTPPNTPAPTGGESGLPTPPPAHPSLPAQPGAGESVRHIEIELPPRPARPAYWDSLGQGTEPPPERVEQAPPKDTARPAPAPSPEPPVTPRGTAESQPPAAPPAAPTSAAAPPPPVRQDAPNPNSVAPPPAVRSTSAVVPTAPHPPTGRATPVAPAGARLNTAEPGPVREARPSLVTLTDATLARRYAAEREQAAFTELVRRYGPAVQAVCARVLGDADRARDAAQATFAALARRAGTLDDRGSLGGWLYRVAYRVALRHRTTAARQRRAERVAAERRGDAAGDPFVGIEDADLWRALREELARLPEKYRLPMVLHYLDGRTHAEVAAAVGLPRGSVAKRIGEGLERLRENLAARGFLG